jgi:phage baseplate assembly protein W
MTTTLTDRILGTGWPKPVYPDVRLGRIVFASAHEKVRQAIGIILETEPGERLMRPTFGCGLRRYLMKPNTTATRALIQLDVVRALTTWEPRIELQSVRVEPGDEGSPIAINRDWEPDPALVLVDIHYLIRADGSAQNLVYPFYLARSAAARPGE